MTRVRKVAAVGLMAPTVAAAVAFGLSRPAEAAAACPPLASATINAPTGTVAAGATVHVSAQVSGLMLLQAHLQVSGPGLNKQVGNSVMSGSISGNVTVPGAGTYTLAVIGNGTKCTYKTAEFTAKERASASPTHSSGPGKSPRPGGAGGSRSGGNGAGALPGGAAGGGTAGNYGLPLNGASPFSLPQVAPDGSAQGFAYPTPEPQVASPPAQPVAGTISETPPVKWGQSLAIALVLLVISAHLGMWSRRQRLAAEAARSPGGGGGHRRRSARKRPRDAAKVAPAASTATTATTAATATKIAPGADSAANTAESGQETSQADNPIRQTGAEPPKAGDTTEQAATGRGAAGQGATAQAATGPGSAGQGVTAQAKTGRGAAGRGATAQAATGPGSAGQGRPAQGGTPAVQAGSAVGLGNANTARDDAETARAATGPTTSQAGVASGWYADAITEPIVTDGLAAAQEESTPADDTPR